MNTQKTAPESESRRILKTVRLLNRVFRFTPAVNLKDEQIAMLPSDRWIANHLKNAYRNDGTFRSGVQALSRATMKAAIGPATLLAGGLCFAVGLPPVVGLIALTGGAACVAFGGKQRAAFKSALHDFKTKTLPDFSRKTKASYATYRGLQLTGQFSSNFAKNLKQRLSERKKGSQKSADTPVEAITPPTESTENSPEKDDTKGAFGRAKDRFAKKTPPKDTPNDNQAPAQPKPGHKPS
ncbi:MAG: hypothetical protein ACQEQL_03625 [Pseudomonadota bacterium]